MKIKFIFFLFFIPTFLFSQTSILIPDRENNQYGYINYDTKEIVIPYQFDVAGRFENGIAMVKKEGLWGIIQEDGSFILPMEYLVIAGPRKINEEAQIKYLKDKVFVKKDKKWGVLDKDFETIIPILYDDIFLLEEHAPFKTSKHDHLNNPFNKTIKTFAAKLDNKWGVITETNNNLYPFEYDKIELVANYDITNENNNRPHNRKSDIYEQEGCSEIINPPKFFTTYLLEKDGVTTILQDNQTTTIPEAGLHDATFCYSSQDDVIGKLFFLRKNNKVGAVDVNGNIVLPFEYENPAFLKSKYFQISKEEKIAIIDINGKIIHPPTFDKISNNIITLNGKLGTLTHDFQNYLITPQYDELKPFYNRRKHDYYTLEKGALFASKDDQNGLIDSLNNIIIPFQKEKMYTYDHETIIATLDGRKRLLDLKGKSLLPKELEFAKNNRRDSEHVFVIKNGLIGIYNYKSKSFIIDPIYKTISSPSGRKYFYIVQKDKKFGLVKKDGSLLLPIEYDKISGAKIQKDDLWGYIDDFGKVLLEPKFQRVYDQFAVMENDLWGILDSVGNWFLAPQFDKVRRSENGYLVSKKNKWGYGDPARNIFIEPTYDEIGNFEGNFIVSKNGFRGVINDTGKVILPIEYKEIKILREYALDKILAKKDSAWGIFNEEGKQLQPCIFSKIGSKNTPRGYVAVFQNKKMGWVDKKGDLVFPCKYDDIRSNKRFRFQKLPPPIFPVKNNNKWGYINQDGNEIIPNIYNRADPFYKGTAVVCLDGMMHVIDKSNQKITHKGYEDIYLINKDTIYRIKDNGKYGIISNKGRTLVPDIYDLLDYKKDLRSLVAKKDNKYGVITIAGEIVFPFDFDRPLLEYKMGVLKFDDSKFMLADGRNLFPSDRIFQEELYQEYYLTQKEDKYGVTNIIDNSTLIPHQYDDIKRISYCEMEYFVVKKGQYHGLIDKNNNIILPFEYLRITGNPEYNIVFAFKNNSVSVHNFEGKIIINDEFLFSNGKNHYEPFGIMKKGKWGYIDRYGKTVIPFIYDRVGSFCRKR